jgi:hypothetical protein
MVKIISLLGFFFLYSISYSANGIIIGKVVDVVSNKSLIGAHVLIKNTKYSATTSNDGSFIFNDIPAGKYQLIVSLSGYKYLLMSNVIVKSDNIVQLDLKMLQRITDSGPDTLFVVNNIGNHPDIDLKMKYYSPDPNIDYKIKYYVPDTNIDYKILIYNPDKKKSVCLIH